MDQIVCGNPNVLKEFKMRQTQIELLDQEVRAGRWQGMKAARDGYIQPVLTLCNIDLMLTDSLYYRYFSHHRQSCNPTKPTFPSQPHSTLTPPHC